MDLLTDMLAHAADTHPDECCGLVVASGKHHRLVRARNLADKPRDTFDLDPDAWLEVGDDEEVVGIYHSHTVCGPEPSMADRTMCEATGLPWHIVSYPQGGYAMLQPEGFEAPYLQRPYVYAIHDCYAVMRDWFSREWDLTLPDYDRDRDGWWDRGLNLYEERFEDAGFVRLVNDEPPEIGDVFLMQIASKVANHGAVYLGDGLILHHVRGRLSTRDVYGGMWLKCTSHHLRHCSRMGVA